MSLAIDSTTGISNINLGASEQYLDGDALLIHLQSQLTSLDGEIKTLTGMQKADIDRKKALNDAYTAGMKYNPPTNQEQWDENTNGMFAAANQLPPDDPERQIILNKIQEIQNKYCATEGGHYPDADNHEWENSMQSFKSESESLSGNAELRMVRIQEIMSKRQTAVQLISSIQQKMNATTEGITQKI